MISNKNVVSGGGCGGGWYQGDSSKYPRAAADHRAGDLATGRRLNCRLRVTPDLCLAMPGDPLESEVLRIPGGVMPNICWERGDVSASEVDVLYA